MRQTVFTIGHSTHQRDRFINLLTQHEIGTICDVRSMPYSRMSPQFNREEVQRWLPEHGISYLFLGRELGARSEDPACYDGGKVQYDRIAQTELFQRGLDRVLEGTEQDGRVALMCTEKEPVECHRMILVARELEKRGVGIQHIHADGRLEPQADALNRLAHALRLPVDVMDMFRSLEDVLCDAYRLQENRIAYDSRRAAATQGAHA